MGSQSSRLLAAEKLNWAKSHSLEIDVNLRDQQVPLVNNFGNRLHLCSQQRSMMGFTYFHFFVTDNCWTIEFGVGDVMQNSVIIHNNPKGEYQVEKSLGKTPAMESRMRAVCGARGYSLCLRNCEHVARYILSGSWVSMQTVAGSRLATHLCNYMLAEHRAKGNSLPQELRPQQIQARLRVGVRSFLTYTGSPEGLVKSDRKAFNVLIIGPTGCGKSNIINHFYNQSVCKSAANAQSVTKHIQITSGMGVIHTQRRQVNVIDTIGFCDSTLKASEVQSIIQKTVEDNVMYVDRVLIVCSGRIEAIHAECIKKAMEWLSFESYPHNFTFVYNKADLLDEAQREQNLIEMCGMLEAGAWHLRNTAYLLKNEPSVVLSQKDVGDEIADCTWRLRIACGLPEHADYGSIEPDLHELLDNTFKRVGDKRIPVDPSWCSIL